MAERSWRELLRAWSAMAVARTERTQSLVDAGEVRGGERERERERERESSSCGLVVGVLYLIRGNVV